MGDPVCKYPDRLLVQQPDFQRVVQENDSLGGRNRGTVPLLTATAGLNTACVAETGTLAGSRSGAG
ncbi:hypothetical protein HK17_10835 [Acetobacter indonesiensis]|uniref:Uncharacterized protein n=1 Tax=Acetobacter indonesiensis TaxID=104101 RepID=A0A252AR33_9PROT|nr:hypothetical protein HK17_10835 [Acetobacter indonesiensis]